MVPMQATHLDQFPTSSSQFGQNTPNTTTQFILLGYLGSVTNDSWKLLLWKEYFQLFSGPIIFQT